MPPALLSALAAGVSHGADLVLAEGLMGLFDGVPAAPGRSGASADIAAAFGWPVLLVLDVSGQSQSAAAVALGCAGFDPRLRIAGVVLNRVGSPRHRRLATEAIERAGLRVVGALPRAAEITLPERHLGLVQATETAELEQILDRLAAFVTEHTDLDRIVGLAQASAVARGETPRLSPPGQRIAIARDEAFTFLYSHLARGWRQAGAELVYFSPLADQPPPSDCDACWLPGGYPELHAGRLARAGRFRDGMRQFATTRPVHGECGGYMVLGRGIIDAAGITHPMLDLLGLVTSFQQRRMTLGYRTATLLADGVLGRQGATLRGHEFHYATIAEPGADPPLALVGDAYGSEPLPAGSRRSLVSGSFFHMIAPTATEDGKEP